MTTKPESTNLPEPVAHIYPSDLEKFKGYETCADCYSVAVGCPDERSVPLYTLSQLVEYGLNQVAELADKREPDQPATLDPLTDTHLFVILQRIDSETKRLPLGFKRFARAIEAAHSITTKGTT